MEENAPVLLKVRASDSLAPGALGVEWRGPKDNILTVKGAVALTDRHRRLPRVVPHGCKAIRFRIEAGDSGARAPGSVRIEKCEIGLEKLAILDHVLLAGCFCHNRVPVRREKCLDHIPIPGELREQLLTGARTVCRFILIMGLLRDRRSRDEQERGNPFRLRHCTR